MFKFSSVSVDMALCAVLVVVTVISFNSCSAADESYPMRPGFIADRKYSSTNYRMNELEQIKPRRGGTVGLFAFPRVGRSDPSLYSYRGYAPSQGQNSYEEYDDQPLEWKRNIGLVPFPRIGRSDSQLRKWSKLAMQQDMDKRTGAASANSGLWFGPRLGRIQKRAADAGGLPGNSRLEIYTPRLGRESEEMTFDEFGNTDYPKNDYVKIFNNLVKNFNKTDSIQTKYNPLEPSFA